jgi:GntR family transcriptional regulator
MVAQDVPQPISQGVPLPPDIEVDKASPVPLYFQVARALEEAITSGRLGLGAQLDNEIALAEALGVSRPTVRRAMQYLVERGLVTRRRGIGTRVVQPKVRRPLELSSLYDDLVRSGQEPRTEVLSLEVGPAQGQVANALGVDEGTPTTTVVRLRCAGDSPIARLTNHIPTDLAPLTREALEGIGLYQLIRARGIQLHSATQSVGARKATHEEARLLGEARGAALLTMQRVAFDDRGTAVEYGDHIYAASRYSFELNLLAH